VGAERFDLVFVDFHFHDGARGRSVRGDDNVVFPCERERTLHDGYRGTLSLHFCDDAHALSRLHVRSHDTYGTGWVSGFWDSSRIIERLHFVPRRGAQPQTMVAKIIP
jgi:hypothetical protein